MCVKLAREEMHKTGLCRRTACLGLNQEACANFRSSKEQKMQSYHVHDTGYISKKESSIYFSLTTI